MIVRTPSKASVACASALLSWLWWCEPASAQCYLSLTGSAAGFGYSQAGPYTDLGQCQAMAGRMGVVANCTCAAAPTAIPPGSSPEELSAKAKAEEEARARVEQAKAAEDAARQRAFLNQRDSAASTLKGGTGTPFFGSTNGLKGVTPPSGMELKSLPPVASNDLGGASQVWRQLNCAAAIAGDAIETLTKNSAPDFDKFNFLISQSASALNGGSVRVPCAAVGAMPVLNRDPKKAFQRLIDRANADVGAYRSARTSRKAALETLIRANETLAKEGDGPAAQALPALRAERQALGPLTLAAPLAPPSPNAKPQSEDEKRKSAMAAAIAAKAAAERSLQDATRAEAVAKGDLDHLAAIAKQIGNGDPKSAALLDQMLGQ